MAEIYTKASDTAIKYSKEVVIKVGSLKAQKSFLENQIATLQTRLDAVNVQLAESEKLGIDITAKTEMEAKVG